jgi:hypothetical protein
MQENVELAEILQRTYAYQEAELNTPVSSVSPTQWCDLKEVRSNPGDDLFAGTIVADVSYTANFSCTFDIFEEPETSTSPICSLFGGECIDPSEWNCGGGFDYSDVAPCSAGTECWAGCTPDAPDPQDCTINPQITLDLITKTPLADEAFSRLVAGDSSVFKRLFPQVGPNAPVEAIADIPAATRVTYTSDDPITVGNPSSQRSGPELYFPHIGSIHQYFLKCIQTALRPQGFGEGCLSAPGGIGTGDFICPYSSIPSMSTNSSCTLSYNQLSASNIPPLMKQVFEAAGAQYNVPPDLIAAVMYSEGGFEARTVASCDTGPGYGEPDTQYTDENIENAILCQFPNCNPDTDGAANVCNYNASQGPATCGGAGTHYGPYQQCPNGYNPCNFYQATFAAADALARGRHGIPDYSGSGDGSTSCVGYNYNTGSIGGQYSCTKSAWTCEDIVTAIRFETGSCIDWHFCDVLNTYGSCNSGC